MFPTRQGSSCWAHIYFKQFLESFNPPALLCLAVSHHPGVLGVPVINKNHVGVGIMLPPFTLDNEREVFIMDDIISSLCAQ